MERPSLKDLVVQKFKSIQSLFANGSWLDIFLDIKYILEDSVNDFWSSAMSNNSKLSGTFLFMP